MTSLNHGDIYLVNFSPSVGHEYQKVRPAIIISSNELLKRANLFTCIAITGKTGNFVHHDDVILNKNAENKLTSDSVVKMHHLCTFDKSRAHKYIGEIDANTMKQIKERIKSQYNL